MKTFRQVFGAVTFVLLASATAFAASVKIEGTPVPAQPKPDFSSMSFLVGTWTCSDLSSRRPGPFTTTEVYSMDPGGYWMMRDSTIHKASWIAREVRSQTKYTYDPGAKHWVRIQIGEGGTYSVATAPMPAGSKKTYTFVIQTTAPDIASYAPEVFTKVSNTKKTMTTSFTETSGRVVMVKETCTKS
ncbi:MAG: hypothetical protein WB609_12600 [Candidatus Cybelea sp.]